MARSKTGIRFTLQPQLLNICQRSSKSRSAAASTNRRPICDARFAGRLARQRQRPAAFARLPYALTIRKSQKDKLKLDNLGPTPTSSV